MTRAVVRVPWDVGDDALEVVVRAAVRFGREQRGPTLDGPGEPAEDDRVEILAVTANGQPRPDLEDRAAEDERLRERVLEEADDVRRVADDLAGELWAEAHAEG